MVMRGSKRIANGLRRCIRTGLLSIFVLSAQVCIIQGASAADGSNKAPSSFKEVFAQNANGESESTNQNTAPNGNEAGASTQNESPKPTPAAAAVPAPTPAGEKCSNEEGKDRWPCKNTVVFEKVDSARPERCQVLKLADFKFQKPNDAAPWPSIFGIALGNDRNALMRRLAWMVDKVPASKTELRQRCPWLQGPNAGGKLFQAEKQPAHEADIIPIFLNPGDKAQPLVPTITITYTPCTNDLVSAKKTAQNQLNAGEIRKGQVQAVEDGLLRVEPNNFASACIDNVSVENFVQDQFALYARFFFRETAPDPSKQPKQEDRKQCTPETVGQYSGPNGQKIHKIEWKTHWPDYEKWLYLARKDVLNSFKDVLDDGKSRSHGKWTSGGTKVRYNWLVDKNNKVAKGSFKRITEWADFKRNYCKCAANDKKCYCSGQMDMQFITLDIGYNPTAKVTLSKGPEYEEAWEYLRNRFVTEEIFKQTRDSYQQILFPGQDTNTGPYDPKADANCRLITPASINSPPDKKKVTSGAAPATK